MVFETNTMNRKSICRCIPTTLRTSVSFFIDVLDIAAGTWYILEPEDEAIATFSCHRRKLLRTTLSCTDRFHCLFVSTVETENSQIQLVTTAPSVRTENLAKLIKKSETSQSLLRMLKNRIEPNNYCPLHVFTTFLIKNTNIIQTTKISTELEVVKYLKSECWMRDDLFDMVNVLFIHSIYFKTICSFGGQSLLKKWIWYSKYVSFYNLYHIHNNIRSLQWW